MTGRPLLWVVIGPNGSGKSTYYEHVVRPHLRAEFVNADLIARDARRTELLEARRSFVFETVFSHPSELAFLQQAQAAGYEVWVTLLFLATEDLAVRRVAVRVASGGHTVPEPKIRERYQRMRALAVPALLLADRGFVIDNSSTRTPLRALFQLDRGILFEREPVLPPWGLALIAALQRA